MGQPGLRRRERGVGRRTRIRLTPGMRASPLVDAREFHTSCGVSEKSRPIRTGKKVIVSARVGKGRLSSVVKAGPLNSTFRVRYWVWRGAHSESSGRTQELRLLSPSVTNAPLYAPILTGDRLPGRGWSRSRRGIAPYSEITILPTWSACCWYRYASRPSSSENVRSTTGSSLLASIALFMVLKDANGRCMSPT